MAHRERFAAVMTAIIQRLPFGLSEVVEPNLLGYLLINLLTFFLDLALLYVFHADARWPLPIAVTLSYGSASAVSYLLNRVLNFRSHANLGKQFPVFVAVSVSNYLIFVLGATDLLTAAGVYFEFSRIIAALCEGVYLYCMMRWVVFRDTRARDAMEREDRHRAAHPGAVDGVDGAAVPAAGAATEPAATESTTTAPGRWPAA